MALSKDSHQPGWHLRVRIAVFTGLLITFVGLFVVLAAWQAESIILGIIGAVPLVCGLALLGVALTLEGTQALALVRSQRGTAGANVLAQVVLAVLLLIGVNVFSALHYTRLDLTRDSLFTIDPELREQLARLQGVTRIVVFQKHTSGRAGDEDDYDAAANRKIIEKVKDLAELFQDLGPRFHVDLLDRQQRGYREQLAELKKVAPQLAAAVESAPEDSIFFEADGKVQRLGFHDVYQLDREASQEFAGGRGNLVLRSQGEGPFARKVLNIDERPPRIAVGVIHEILGMENNQDVNKEIGMAGAKKALESHGFKTRDIVLKKWGEMTPPEPAVLTYDESRYDRLEEQLAEVEATVKSRKEALAEFSQAKKEWSGSLEEINKKYTFVEDADGDVVLIEKADLEAQEKKLKRKFRRLPIEERERQRYLNVIIEPRLAVVQINLQQDEKERDDLRHELAGLNVEDLSEQRRISDLRAKFKRMLSDCDMLIVPRMTLFNVARGDLIPNRVYRLEAAQVEAIKEFLASGKPVLFALGPTNEPPARPDFEGPDQLEASLEDLGFKLPKQAILFNVETKSFGERRGALLIVDRSRVEVPPVEFDWRPGGRLRVLEERPPNAIRTSLRVASRAASKEALGDLRLRHPRPVYYEPQGGRSSKDPTFLMTSTDAWNEAQPFPTRDKTPRYEPPKLGDPDRNTINERRTGQFPIGVAAEVRVPLSWAPEKEQSKRPTRVAVIGHGGAFMGPMLSPVREKLLLDVSNWLLGRDDLLARESRTWSYPRVELSAASSALWRFFAVGAMPLACVYAGVVVLMVRHRR
jgi:hypothetical protein